ncbi:MAG: hypothetical protein Q8Q59_06360 [Luteolibacter sp.]|jgi:hypothetical protein|nr:hypothetical protein [Luteolibacter sp.]
MKLASISSDPILVQYSQGAAQTATSSVADFLAPTVPVATSVGRFKKYTAKSRFRIPDTRRAVGGRATQIGFSAEDENYNCSPHALDFPVDVLEQIEADGLMNIMQEGADICAQVGALAHEKSVIELALTTLGGGTALAIGGGDDIISQIDTNVLSVIKAAKMGAFMNVGVVFGAGAWRVAKNHASVRGRLISGGKRDIANVTLEDFGNLLISKCDSRVSLMCFDDAAEGLDEDIEFVLDGDIIVFARTAQPTRFDPSFMKTFRLRNQWMKPGTYQREDGRAEVAKFDWSEDIQATNPAAGIRRTVALG